MKAEKDQAVLDLRKARHMANANNDDGMVSLERLRNSDRLFKSVAVVSVRSVLGFH